MDTSAKIQLSTALQRVNAERVRTNLQRFQEEVRQRLRVLEAAVSEAEGGSSPEAVESVRRVARSIGHSAVDHGLVDIQRRAEAVVAAETREQLIAHTRSLHRFATRKPAASATSAARILVIEDDPGSARLLQSIIEDAGHEFLVADRAAEAERLLEEHAFDLVVLDLILPDADGRDFLIALRHRPATADVPVIVSSALPASRAEAECLALGAQAYLEKPLRPAMARSAVVRLLAAEDESGDGSATWRSWVANLAALNEAYESEGDEAVGSGNPRSLARIEMVGFSGAAAEDGHEEALHRVLSRVRDSVSPTALLAADPAGKLYALLPGTAADATAQILREATGDETGEDGRAMHVRAGVVDVSERPPLREAMARADRLFGLTGSEAATRVLVSGQEDTLPSDKLLFVEDDQVTARLVMHRLGKEGFEVLHFDHGQAALEAAKLERVALAIFDIKLPGMDGFELLQNVRKLPHFEGVPVIMLTSVGREPDVVRGFELGADDYVLKPFSPMELLARIHRLLGDRGPPDGT